MSVHFYKTRFEDLFEGWGRQEAWWLTNHLYSSHIGDTQATRIGLRGDALEEQFKEAEECDAICEYFEGGKEEHDRITKEMRKTLPKLIKEEKLRVKKSGDKHWRTHDWLDLEISW